MKIIFSRKGFDDAYGGSASPILPDGTLLSLPIPAKPNEKGVLYKNLSYNRRSYNSIMKELGIKLPSQKCHLDPDLTDRRNKRIKDWQPAFGQHGAAAKHLMNEGVEPGDLFLYFGTFKRTYLDGKNKIQFENDHPRHILFGYLLIGECLKVSEMTATQKAKYHWHPHLQNDYGKNNLLYTAAMSDRAFKNTAGTFKYSDDLVLTRNGYRKSIWELPSFFHPENGVEISRHKKQCRFQKRFDLTILQTIGIGQDFVVHSNNESIGKWALALISNNEKI